MLHKVHKIIIRIRELKMEGTREEKYGRDDVCRRLFDGANSTRTTGPGDLRVRPTTRELLLLSLHRDWRRPEDVTVALVHQAILFIQL